MMRLEWHCWWGDSPDRLFVKLFDHGDDSQHPKGMSLAHSTNGGRTKCAHDKLRSPRPLSLMHSLLMVALVVLGKCRVSDARMAPAMNDFNLPRAVNSWASDPASATITYGPISAWDTSAVTNMRSDLLLPALADGHLQAKAGHTSKFVVLGGQDFTNVAVSLLARARCIRKHEHKLPALEKERICTLPDHSAFLSIPRLNISQVFATDRLIELVVWPCQHFQVDYFFRCVVMKKSLRKASCSPPTENRSKFTKILPRTASLISLHLLTLTEVTV